MPWMVVRALLMYLGSDSEEYGRLLRKRQFARGDRV